MKINLVLFSFSCIAVTGIFWIAYYAIIFVVTAAAMNLGNENIFYTVSDLDWIYDLKQFAKTLFLQCVFSGLVSWSIASLYNFLNDHKNLK